MDRQFGNLQDLITEEAGLGSIRVAAVSAAQPTVLETLREAESLGLVDPRLIGDPPSILRLAKELDWKIDDSRLIAADDEATAAAAGVRLVRDGEADVVMKGHLHTEAFMRALLHEDRGLRVPGRRVSHVFVTDIPTYPKLLHITDAAVNIAPDLNAKAQIVQNAVEMARLLGVERPKVAALSAVETVNPAIPSTLDAACLSLMARRGQISGAVVDGPLAFDNAISAKAARQKGIESDVAGETDIVLVPDLVSGNILAKNLEYLAGATAAGIVTGLSGPVVLNSRADPLPARLAGLALAVLIHHRSSKAATMEQASPESSFHCAPQPESVCCPMPV
jgi:phosphotransacetylase